MPDGNTGGGRGVRRLKGVKDVESGVKLFQILILYHYMRGYFSAGRLAVEYDRI